MSGSTNDALAGALVVVSCAMLVVLLLWLRAARRLRNIAKHAASGPVERDVAVALVGADAERMVASVLAALATSLGAKHVALCLFHVGASSGLRAEVHGPKMSLLHADELSDADVAMVDAALSADPITLGQPNQDPRMTRFAGHHAMAAGSVVCVLRSDGGGAWAGTLSLAEFAAPLSVAGLAQLAASARLLGTAMMPGSPLEACLQRHQASQTAAFAQRLHDPLTGMPTRALLVARLTEALAQRDDDRPLGLVLVRLGGLFTAIESFGPEAGAAVLGEVGNRVAHLLRRADLAARVGDNEFALLLLDLREVAEATTVAERLRDGLAESVQLGGVELDTAASIGIRVIPADELPTINRVFADAAAALGAAPSGSFRIFDSSLANPDGEQLVAELRDALGKDQLSLQYQPIVDLGDGAVLGAEALVRWSHPARGAVAPLEFLPLADDAGLAPQLGIWVLDHACRQLKEWQQRYPRSPALAMSVNVAAAHLASADFGAEVLRVIDASGVDPECVILEFAEEVLLGDLAGSPAKLDSLQRAGVHLAVDDVGTGHATLEYLRSLPVDILKIGRPFIAALADQDPATSTAHAIVEQGEALRLSLVAEGVETGQQINLLRELGCVMAQGFHLSRPLDAGAMDALLVAGSVDLGASAPVDSAH